MKFFLVVTSALLVSATPFTSSDDSLTLEARGKSKCQWKEARCCDVWSKPGKYGEAEYDTGYGYGYGKTKTHYVKHPQRIQDAIKKAGAGDRIIVKAGTYAEQITIHTDGIQLIGQPGAKIVKPVKPVKPVKNTCSGIVGPNTEAGICVTGKGVKLTKFIAEHKKVESVEKPVRGVSVTGFHVEGFSGINIAVVGAHSTKISKNTLLDAVKYGGLTLGSTKTVFSDNRVNNKQFGLSIGICMDDKSKVLITKNKLNNHLIGLCVQTNNAQVQYNRVKGACFGIFVDPFIKGARIVENYVGPSSPVCIEYKIPVTGIVVDGAVNTQVKGNTIEGQKNNGQGTGIAIVDDECNGTPPSIQCIINGKRKAVASGTVVLRNKFADNEFDIFNAATGTGNVVSCNKCNTPAELCAN